MHRTGKRKNSLRINLAGWDNDERPTGRAEREMTFTYAVIAEGGIVLAADSQVTYTHRDELGVIGTYEGCRGKIKRTGNRFAFSMAGNGGLADTLLAKVNLQEAESLLPSFEAVVQYYEKSMHDELLKIYRPEVRNVPLEITATFIFCGYTLAHGQQVPQLVKLDSVSHFLPNPITGRGWAWTGADRHGGALYLHHRFYRDGMPLEQAKLLAYCIAAEVAHQDNTVGGPIEVEVITPEKSEPLRDLEKYENARQQMISKILSYVENFG